MRLGGPVFVKTDDPEELALKHQKIGYRAAYCPEGLSVRDTAKIRTYREAFKKKDIVFAEVGAWCNPLDPKEGCAEKNIAYITERLALAEELGALCCVNIVGTCDADSWFAPHSRNFSDETFERTVAIARRVIDAVKPKGTKFTLEMFAFTFLDCPAEYVRLLKAVDRPRMVEVTGAMITEWRSRPKGSRVRTMTGRVLSRSASQTSPRRTAAVTRARRRTGLPNRCRRRGHQCRQMMPMRPRPASVACVGMPRCPPGGAQRG